MKEDSILTYRITVKGKVQGVWYRKNTQEQADKLGIKGWVKNLPDESVLIEAEGKWEQLQTFIDWCKIGPTEAKVSGIELCLIETKNFSEFSILR